MVETHQHGKERAKWTRAEEESLLQLWRVVRSKPEFHGEKGLKRKAWTWVATEMASRHGTANAKEKGVIQSKFFRLMKEYKLFLWLCGLPGVAQDAQGRIAMPESEWQRLIGERKSVEASMLRKLKQFGFPLAAQCAAANADDAAAAPDTGDFAVAAASVGRNTRGSTSNPPMLKSDAAFREHDAEAYGLQMNRNEQGAVESVTCRFCLTFGREFADDRRCVEEPMTFYSFRADNYKQHLIAQHSVKWTEYQRCSSAAKKCFFSRDAGFANTIASVVSRDGEEEDNESLEEEEEDAAGESNNVAGVEQRRPPSPQQDIRNKRRRNDAEEEEDERGEEEGVEHGSLTLKERELRLRERELEFRREELAERKKQRLDGATQHEKQFGLLVDMVEKLHRTQTQLLSMIAGALGKQQQQ